MGIVHILLNNNIGKFGKKTTITNTNGDSKRIKLAYINSHKIGEIPKTGSRIVILNFVAKITASSEQKDVQVYQGKSRSMICFSFFCISGSAQPTKFNRISSTFRKTYYNKVLIFKLYFAKTKYNLKINTRIIFSNLMH